MKKSLILSFAASAMLLTNCSNDDEIKRPAYIPGDSEVEISLSSNTVIPQTRAAIEGDGDITGMGVFCLARAYQSGGSGTINWGASSSEDPTCLMNNVLSNKVNGSVVWDDASVKYYYPAYQLYNYSFYGYYPYSSSASVTGNSISVDYTIDGETDIIWGQAVGSSSYAYSAAYYREETNPTDPTLTLNHMLTRIAFVLEQGEAAEGEAATNLTLDKIVVKNVVSSCNLTIADNENPSYSGSLTSGSGTTDIELKTSNLPCTAVAASGSSQAIALGDGLMLYPVSTFDVELTTTTSPADGAPETNTVTVPLTLSNGGDFVAGNSYQIKILINGPRRISLYAQLVPWNEVAGPSIKL